MFQTAADYDDKFTRIYQGQTILTFSYIKIRLRSFFFSAILHNQRDT